MPYTCHKDPAGVASLASIVTFGGGVCDSWALAPLVKTQGSMSRVEPINPRGREVVTMSISQLAGTVGPGAYSAFSGASLTTESAS